MPINVACSKCSQKFAAPDKLAGKAVRCPKCSNPITIPAASSPAAAAPTPAANSGMENLFDEAGIESTAPGGMRCPNCFTPMQAGAVMCISCGFNAATGEKTEGFAVAGFEEDNPAFRAAGRELEDESRERRKSVDPVPWYYYACGLLVLASNAVFFSMCWKDMLESTIPKGAKASFIGDVFIFLIVLDVPFVLGFVSHWAIANWAFYEDSFQKGMMVVFLPLFDIVYAFQNRKQKGMLISIVMWIVGFIWALVVTVMLVNESLPVPEIAA